MLRADEFNENLSGIVHAKRHFAACADREREMVGGVYILHFAVCSPTDRHLLSLVDKINLAMERAHAARREVDKAAQDWDVLRFQRVPPRPEQIERLPVQKENCLLRFMHNQLG